MPLRTATLNFLVSSRGKCCFRTASPRLLEEQFQDGDPLLLEMGREGITCGKRKPASWKKGPGYVEL